VTNAHREYQQNYYDRTYPRRAAVVAEQLDHPLFRAFNDRLAGRVLDGVRPLPGPPDASTNGHGSRPLRVFEPACGEGFLGAALLRVAKERGIDLRYAGADLSQAAVDLARPILGDDLVVGDATEVLGGMPAGAADVIIVKNLLHHLVAPADVLREAARVVGPTGRVVILEGRLGCPHFMLLATLAPKREKFYFYGTRRNRAAVAKAKLTLVHQERFSFLPYELFLQPRPNIMRRIFSTSDPAALDRYRKLDDGLAKVLPFWSSYWVWVAAPTAADESEGASGVKST
jgi:SAM-dependent methyltransferase